MNAPQVKCDGETWEYIWHDLRVAIGFEALREGRDGLHGELWVAGGDVSNGHADHIQWTTFNLSSATARRNTGLQLTHRENGRHLKAEEWIGLLEHACTQTALDFRKGEPARDLSEAEPTLDLPYLVSPIIPEGQPTIFYGAGESSKGWIALGLCMALRLGGEVLPGLAPTTACNSLYLDWESDFEANVRRQEYIRRGLGIHVRPPGIYYRRMFRPLADEVSKIRELVGRTKAKLVVIDSIALAAAGEVKDSDPATRFMAAVRALGTTPLLLGHVTKAQSEAKGGDRGRVIGSYFYELLARSCWELRADADVQPVIVGFYNRKANVGRRQASFGLKLTFDDAPQYRVRFTRCELDESGRVAEGAPLAERLVAALRRGAMSTSELAEDLGVSQAQVRGTSGRLADAKDARIVQLTTRAGKGGRGRESVWGLRALGEAGEPSR